MKELSLHILDIVQNSIAAEASLIKIKIQENLINDLLYLKIVDDGEGMTPEEQKEVIDPFVTSRQTREVGLGLPLLKRAAQNCGGDLELNSTPGEGTEIKVKFKHSHIDRAPLGNIAGTITTLLTTNPNRDFIYNHLIQKKETEDHFKIDTRNIKKQLADVAINNPQILEWLKSYIKENLEKIRDNN